MSAPAQAGLDVAAVAAWLREQGEPVVEPLEAVQLAGGHSNLTFSVTGADGRRWVLRRPPLGELLETAHDMGREVRVQAALAGSPVPVPRIVGLADGVLDAPFYVMDHVDGHVVRDPQDAEATFEPADREAAARHLVDALAALHAVDPAAVGLEGFGRPDGYMERQLRRWHRQWEATPGRRPLGLVDELHRRLVAAVPPQRRTSIVHGDYRLDNAIVDRRGRLRAVLDWELSTLGDPLADLGTMLAHWIDLGVGAPPPTALEGFPDRARVAELYGERAGEDVSDVGYYTAFAHWRLACICEGVFVRYRDGAMGDDEVDLDLFGLLTRAHAEAALRALEER